MTEDYKRGTNPPTYNELMKAVLWFSKHYGDKVPRHAQIEAAHRIVELAGRFGKP